MLTAVTRSTIAYYDANAESFVRDTGELDLQSLYAPFLALKPTGGHVLDAGCGPGRDSKAFLDRGYAVSAFDGSEAMVLAATRRTGLSVRHLTFQDVDYPQIFDGVWACASLLHVPYSELQDVFHRLLAAIVTGGVVYASFKWGDSERVSKGRQFTDFTPSSLTDWLGGFDRISIHKVWETTDVREQRSEDLWVNVVARVCQ